VNKIYKNWCDLTTTIHHPKNCYKCVWDELNFDVSWFQLCLFLLALFSPLTYPHVLPHSYLSLDLPFRPFPHFSMGSLPLSSNSKLKLPFNSPSFMLKLLWLWFLQVACMQKWSLENLMINPRRKTRGTCFGDTLSPFLFLFFLFVLHLFL